MARVKKYYDFEYDRIITEETARRNWSEMSNWRKSNGMSETTFEQYVSENLYDLSNKTERTAAQALHDRNGMFEPVCSWSMLMRMAH